MKNSIYINILRFILIFLWLYVIGEKVGQWDIFRQQLQLQYLPKLIIKPLAYLLPLSEFCAALLLTIPETINKGFIFSGLLLSAFTAYITLILAGGFPKVPCPCGGVIEHLSWQSHWYFNLTFLAFSLTGYIIIKKERRYGDKNQ